MYINQSTLLDFNDNKPIFSICVNTIWFWLFLHSCYIGFVTFFVLSPPVLLLYVIKEFVWIPYRYGDRLIEDFSMYERDYSRFGLFRRYVRYEGRLIFIYVSLAFIFTLMMNNHSIHWIKIFYWMIEASYVPFTFFLVFFTDFLEFSNDEPYILQLDLIQPCDYIVKACLFVWMRYVQLYPSSRLNDYQTYFFYCYCDPSNIHHIPNDHLLHRWLRP